MTDPLGSLTAVTASRATTPLDKRERLLEDLTRAPRERSFVFATCHRVELYTLAPAPRVAAAVFRGTDAVRHLFRVAAGLDSVVVGERQVVGQLRRARDRVSGEPLLESLLERALRVAREVRRRTALGAMTGSLGSLAVDEALRHLAHPAEATALVLGAGEMGKLASRALSRRVRTLLIANRGEERAIQLARDVDAEAVPLERLDEALARADAVISAADTRGALLDGAHLSARLGSGPLVVVDLAVPRSVSVVARGLPGLIYRDADDLHDIAVPPADVVAAAERICAEEAHRFVAERRERAAVPVISAMRRRADDLRARQLTRALSKLGHLDDRDRRVVSALASSLTNALLHRPTVALRSAPNRAAAARELFGLDEGTS